MKLKELLPLPMVLWILGDRILKVWITEVKLQKVLLKDKCNPLIWDKYSLYLKNQIWASKVEIIKKVNSKCYKQNSHRTLKIIT